MGKQTKSKSKKVTLASTGLELRRIDPLTLNQEVAFESDKHLVLHGLAGTGKTFISMYLALREIESFYAKKVVVIRSAVPTRDIGFLPGGEKEKTAIYEEPYKEVCDNLFGRGDAYSILKSHRVLEFMTTSFIRGITLDDAVIVVDECQNMSLHELDSIITRVGTDCRIMFCGDFRQSDLDKHQSGLKEFFHILEKMDSFTFVDFQIADIVRSNFVKQYILAKHGYGPSEVREDRV